MRFSPSGPWYTAYIDATTASSTCAVQMLLVAFSRRMCCSRRLQREPQRDVPGIVSRHTDEATRQRARVRRLRRDEPGVRAAEAERDAEPLCRSDDDVRALFARGRDEAAGEEVGRDHRRARRRPARGLDERASGPGSRPSSTGSARARRTARRHRAIRAAASPTSTTMPSGSARVCTTAIVCGWQPASTTNRSEAEDGASRRAIAIASAAAVGSSRSEAFASSIPVRSLTIVWKLSNASSRPCEISGW